MNFYECLKSAARNVFSNKTRTFLTMLGIIIGISSVILIVSIGKGSQAAIQEEFDSITTGSFTLNMAATRDIETRDILDMDDYELLKDIEGVAYVSPVYSGRNTYVKLLNPRETKSASVSGVTSDNFNIEKPTLLYGRYISSSDVDMRAKVAVINDATAKKVFGVGGARAIGRKISLKTWKGSAKFTVIGILENADASSESQNSNEFPEKVVIPVTSAMELYGNFFVNGFSILIDDLNQTDAMKEKILNVLSEEHKNENKYYITDSADTVDSINSILSYVTLFISFVAGISLLVGGIGVMNIMMVTVTERTREIGVRKSLGAKNGDIRAQFISEAILFTGMGGVIGLAVGYGGAIAVGNIIGVKPVTSVSAVALAVGISMAIGIIFGVAPANKAAMLDPIEALRYE